jgi:Prealbumin-like fold domain
MTPVRSGARPRLARRLSWLAVLSLTTAALLAPSASPVLAASVSPIAVSGGNPTCATFAATYGGGQPWQEVKSDPPGNGTINVAGFGTITVSNFEQSDSGQPGSFDWSSTFGIDAVFVKAGSSKHQLYVYAATAGATESTGDTDLEPQAGSGNGISHISFCFDTAVDPTPEPTPDPTPDPTPEPTPDPTPDPTPEPTPDPTPDPTPEPTGEPNQASILIAKVDNNGTADPSDDEALDGATFEVWADDGDEAFETDQDELVFGPAAAPGGMVDTDLLDGGMYWIVETIVPDGFVGSDPILVELNIDPSVTCIWDFGGLIECEPNQGDVSELSWTIVIVDNTPESQPTGEVGGSTGTPRATLPATDTLDGTATTAPAGESWRLILLAMAGVLTAVLMLTPARAAVRKDDSAR